MQNGCNSYQNGLTISIKLHEFCPKYILDLHNTNILRKCRNFFSPCDRSPSLSTMQDNEIYYQPGKKNYQTSSLNPVVTYI